MPATQDVQRAKWKDRANSAAHAPGTRSAIRAIGLAVPVLLVNTVAFFGQFGYLRAHLPWPTVGVVLAALALESIAIYLQWQAHLAQMSNDSALRLRLASYFLALVIGALNYSHYAGPHWRPTAAAVICGLMSVISPWLWSVHSRRVSRDELMARGLVEEHALRLGATRWTWHLARSLRVMHAATWSGETSPARAVAEYGKPGWPALVPPRAALAHATVPPAQPDPVPPPRAMPALEPVPDLAPVPEPARHELSEEDIERVELALAGMTQAELQRLTYRAVGRMLGEDGDYRNTGRKLLDAARLAKQQTQQGRPPARAAGANMPWPATHSPGGVGAG